jgi:hypothetical protein
MVILQDPSAGAGTVIGAGHRHELQPEPVERRALTPRTSQQDLGYVLTRLNQVMHGWANYFRHAVAKSTFGMLDHFTWRRVIRMLSTRHHWGWKDVRQQYTTPQGRWLPINAGEVELRRIAAIPITRYRYRGSNIPSRGLPGNQPDGGGHGEPVALRGARRVRRAAWGNGPGVIPAPRPRPTPPSLRACPAGTPVTAEFVIGSYHQLFEIERSFRMSKSDLQARPIYHRKRDSIEAHLTIVFAAWPSAAGLKTPPAGQSGNSSAPPAATAPSRSRPARTPSPPPTRCPTTSAKPSKRSPVSAGLRTNLAQLRSDRRSPSGAMTCETSSRSASACALEPSREPVPRVTELTGRRGYVATSSESGISRTGGSFVSPLNACGTDASARTRRWRCKPPGQHAAAVAPAAGG